VLTLWDLLAPERPAKPRRVQTPAPTRPAGRRDGATARYATMEREMLRRYGVRVRKWRSGTTGVAWQILYRDGTTSRLIESPRPRGPVSAAVFLHEIGHHAIGFNRYRPRCLEEYHAWRFSLDEMERWGIHITDRVRTRVCESLQYAIDKAKRRGLRDVPAEVTGCIAEQQRLIESGGRQSPRSDSLQTRAAVTDGR
jgi:hypothetical protein